MDWARRGSAWIGLGGGVLGSVLAWLRLRLEGGESDNCNPLDKEAGRSLSPVKCILAKTIVPPPRPLLCQHHKPTKNELKGRKLRRRRRRRGGESELLISQA